MTDKKRSDTQYPQADLDLSGALSKAWAEGWMDEYSDDHFLIKAIEGRLKRYKGFHQFGINDVALFPVDEDSFQETFCMNFSWKVACLIDFFGESKTRSFFTNQLSAGKEKYDEAQFFRALSEVSILCFWIPRSKSGEYEPKVNGKKNPEARFNCVNGVTVDVEVKTPGFHDFDGIQEIVLPAVLLSDEGREKFSSFCGTHGINGVMPRVGKLKEFLNSAAEKFEVVDHINHMNFLYINWTFSEVMESGFEEAFSLLAHPINGILFHKDIGLSLGVNEEVYEKITAVIVYTESASGLMFGDFRWVWTQGSDGMPHFGIIGMHNLEDLFEITGMNPFGKMITPTTLSFAKDTTYLYELDRIVADHMLKTVDTDSV